MKRTKILATIGPASNNQETIRQMVEKGVNAFRINLSHGNQEQWKEIIDNIRSVAKELPIFLDTKGQEIRIVNIHEEIELDIGQEFVFSLKPRDDIAHLSQYVGLKEGQKVLFDDGAMCVEVKKIENDLAYSYVHNEGTLTNKRKATIPDANIMLPVLTDDDIINLKWAQTQDVDGVALSFTQSAADIKKCREYCGELMIIAKIENRVGVDNIQEIIETADGVMVARGDLGVEIPLQEVPMVQKKIIRDCNELAKPVIVATQMLESMMEASIPTRAEASDIANAILDGADCLMLSGETAMGVHPVVVIETMNKIAMSTEVHTKNRIKENSPTIADAISHAVYDLTQNIEVDHILCATTSGATARKVARYRPKPTILAVSHQSKTVRKLQITWGVTSCLFNPSGNSKLTTIESTKTALEKNFIHEDDLIITTAGIHTMQAGTTNLIEVHNVKDLLEFNE